MKTRSERTIKNPRWWAAMPLMLAVLPLACLISATAWLYEAFHFQVSNRIVGFLRRVDRNGMLRPIIKWTYRN